MAVKIDMDIPKCCIECRFCRWADYKEKWACYAQEPVKYMSSQNYENGKKMRGCPLKECENV